MEEFIDKIIAPLLLVGLGGCLILLGLFMAYYGARLVMFAATEF